MARIYEPVIERSIGRMESDSFSVFKFGRNADIDTATETVWSLGGLYAYPASASVMTVSSSSANDAAAGTGARTVKISGLDSNWDRADETVTLNGQTAVTTTTSFIRVFRMEIMTWGSGGTNAGVIYVGTGTVTSGVPANKYSAISAGDDQTMQAFYTVPDGYYGIITDYNISTSTNQFITMQLRARKYGTAGFNLQVEHVINDNSVSASCAGIKFDEKTDIEWRGTGASVNNTVAANFAIVMVKK